MIFKNPASVHTPLAAYSHQAQVGGNAKWLVMSGQIGMNKEGAVPQDVINQTEIALDNILLNLQEAQMELKDLVKLVFYFVGEHNIDERRRLISKKLGEHCPCTTLMYVAGLAGPNIKVEIDAWACRE